MTHYPRLLHIVLDGFDIRALAEFYRQLLGLQYRPGDEPPACGRPDDSERLVLTDPEGHRCLAFQRYQEIPGLPGPDHGLDSPLQLDVTVPDLPSLLEKFARAIELGAVTLLDRSDDPNEPLVVLVDPARHPFCVQTPSNHGARRQRWRTTSGCGARPAAF